MSDHDHSPEPQGRPQSPGEGRPSASRGQSPAQSQTKRSQSTIHECTNLLHSLLEDTVAGQISDNQLLERLSQQHASAEETSDILDELADQRCRPRPEDPGMGQGENDPHSREQDPLHEKLSWAIVQAKIDALRATTSGSQDTVEFLDALRGDTYGQGIPESVLAVAPHLKDVIASAESDTHLAKTFEIREHFSREKVADRTISYLQLARLDDSLPKAIWRDVLADKYVNFEKVHVAIDSRFNHDDDAKDFAGGYVLLKKDQANARKPVESETDWTRVFDAWASTVKLVYRHHEAELDSYKRLILKLFRARHSKPHLAILVDHNVREDYAKSPFHLDDRAHSDIPLFTHLVSSSPAQSSSGKRPGSLMARIAPVKRATVVCENWNFGRASGASKLDADAEAEQMVVLAQQAVTEGNYSMEDPDLDAVRVFCDREVGTWRWSAPIDPHLAPCMKTSLMFVVWQNEKARVVTDHSASGLNDGIPHSEAKVRYDDMHNFGQILFDAHRRYPDHDLTLYKSDVSTVFLNLPAHLIWQLRQVVTVDDDFHIMRRLVFGSRASLRIWCSVSALLCWIAIHKYNICGLIVYMDDFFGWDFCDPEHLLFFHGHLRPSCQVRLLLFWAYVVCPFDDPKQLDGPILKIIGFWNNVINFTISMPPSVVDTAVEAIDRFFSSPEHKVRLRDWQRLAGHLNWILNVLPWGRPALTEMYRKMAHKTNPNAWVFLNHEVTSDLTWFHTILLKAIGRWGPEEADITVWTDAALRGGMSFVFHHSAFVYEFRKDVTAPGHPDILFFEMLAVVSALAHLAKLDLPPRRVLFFSDILDGDVMFDSMRATDSQHNAPLLAIASVAIETGIDFHVLHIPGKDNVRADMLSRLMYDDYARQYPADTIQFFSPPRELLPSRWRDTF
ncbi:hypothetical protein V8D89_012103 [Ganoderma adspersum]